MMHIEPTDEWPSSDEDESEQQARFHTPSQPPFAATERSRGNLHFPFGERNEHAWEENDHDIPVDSPLRSAALRQYNSPVGYQLSVTDTLSDVGSTSEFSQVDGGSTSESAIDDGVFPLGRATEPEHRFSRFSLVDIPQKLTFAETIDDDDDQDSLSVFTPGCGVSRPSRKLRDESCACISCQESGSECDEVYPRCGSCAIGHHECRWPKNESRRLLREYQKVNKASRCQKIWAAVKRLIKAGF